MTELKVKKLLRNFFYGVLIVFLLYSLAYNSMYLFRIGSNPPKAALFFGDLAPKEFDATVIAVEENQTCYRPRSKRSNGFYYNCRMVTYETTYKGKYRIQNNDWVLNQKIIHRESVNYEISPGERCLRVLLASTFTVLDIAVVFYAVFSFFRWIFKDD